MNYNINMVNTKYCTIFNKKNNLTFKNITKIRILPK